MQYQGTIKNSFLHKRMLIKVKGAKTTLNVNLHVKKNNKRKVNVAKKNATA